MKFKKTVILEKIGIAKRLKDALKQYSEEVVYFDSNANSDEEKIRRIADADAVLITWATSLSRNVIEKTNLKYIGLCSTFYLKNCNVDLEAAEKKGITVTGISDYGDVGTIEFVISEAIMHFQKTGRELKSKKIGIIGMGNVGKKLAKAFPFFGADVSYYNRSRKPDIESLGVKYHQLESLLKSIDILVLSLPRNTCVLQDKEFRVLDAELLINISIGTPFELEPFYAWLKRGHAAVFDKVGLGDIEVSTENVQYHEFVSGITKEAEDRQAEKVIENIKRFLTA